MKKKLIYKCNEGSYKAELLADDRPLPWSDGQTVRIKLLERVPFVASGKKFWHEIGDILSVGHWQVEEE